MSEEPEARKPGPSRKAVIGWTVGILGALIALGGCGIHCHRALHRATHPGYTCKSNLRQIGLACHMYADENNGEFPLGFEQLMPRCVDSNRLFECPGGVGYDYYGKKKWGTEFRADRCNYALENGMNVEMPVSLVLAYDDSPENHDGKGRNVVFADAHVEWWPASREAEFQKKLAAQREAVKKWREAGAKKEDMAKFFGKLGNKEQK